MDAWVKISGIDKPVIIEKCQKVFIISKKSRETTSSTNLETCAFDASRHYILVGNTRLHVDGAKIEYVLFKS